MKKKTHPPSKLLAPREILVTLPASVDTPYKEERSASNSLSQPSLQCHAGPPVDKYRQYNAHLSCLCGLEREVMGRTGERASRVSARDS